MKRVSSPSANGPELDLEWRIYPTRPFPKLLDFSIETENQQKKKHYFCSTNTGDDDDADDSNCDRDDDKNYDDICQIR